MGMSWCTTSLKASKPTWVSCRQGYVHYSVVCSALVGLQLYGSEGKKKKKREQKKKKKKGREEGKKKKKKEKKKKGKKRKRNEKNKK